MNNGHTVLINDELSRLVFVFTQEKWHFRYLVNNLRIYDFDQQQETSFSSKVFIYTDKGHEYLRLYFTTE